MSNKEVKAILDHIHNAQHSLEDGLAKLASNTNLSQRQRQAKNFARTIDHQVTEIHALSTSLSNQNLPSAAQQAKHAKKCFTDLSRLLWACSQHGTTTSLEQAKTCLKQGLKSIAEVGVHVHKKDDMHIEHINKLPKVKYNPKKNKEEKATEPSR